MIVLIVECPTVSLSKIANRADKNVGLNAIIINRCLNSFIQLGKRKVVNYNEAGTVLLRTCHASRCSLFQED